MTKMTQKAYDEAKTALTARLEDTRESIQSFERVRTQYEDLLHQFNMTAQGYKDILAFLAEAAKKEGLTP